MSASATLLVIYTNSRRQEKCSYDKNLMMCEYRYQGVTVAALTQQVHGAHPRRGLTAPPTHGGYGWVPSMVEECGPRWWLWCGTGFVMVAVVRDYCWVIGFGGGLVVLDEWLHWVTSYGG